jgi:hypothetical protein
MSVFASGFTVSGAQGALYFLAFLLALIAAFVAWFIKPRAIWGTLVAAAVALACLAHLFTG